KKSREESSGAGSGVEILVNEPYKDGPGGQGQYTHKIYHVGSHLPGWLKGILPKTALMVEEEAWNAYPYTKTRYTCPFVEKFSLEIETYYYEDNGHQENVFHLSGSDLRNRIVDVIDVVKDQLYGADYLKNEDPSFFKSEKSSRGPLSENWLEEYWKEVQGKPQPLSNGKALMCAYKLCRVEFRYWGMQTKIEKFIHDIALRKTMLRAHRQAWAWQDEWHGLTMEDIREIEKQTQLALKRKMGQIEDEEIDEDDNLNNSTPKEDPVKTLAATLGSIEVSEDSPLLSKNSNIPIIQTAVSSDADLSPEDETIYNLSPYSFDVSPSCIDVPQITHDSIPIDEVQVNETGYLTAPSPRRRSSSTSEQSNQMKFDFDITDFFMFGSPLALVLAYRKIAATDDKSSIITRPSCLQVYNLFHPTDPVAARLEPLLSARFSILPPVNVARYAKYPLGNGQPYHLLEILQTNPQMFSDSSQHRRLSECNRSGGVVNGWIMLYIVQKNVTANHRANDIIVREGAPQLLSARFMYGPLDMVALTGEKVDIHVMRDVAIGEWIQIATEVTDKTGRITHTIPEEKSVGYGLYPIKPICKKGYILSNSHRNNAIGKISEFSALSVAKTYAFNNWKS
ncbi:retinal degeneration B, partial [Asbolus verrucosus]